MSQASKFVLAQTKKQKKKYKADLSGERMPLLLFANFATSQISNEVEKKSKGAKNRHVKMLKRDNIS
jgi:hypothetical protein